MTLQEIEELSYLLASCSRLITTSYYYKLRFQHPEEGIYLICSSTSMQASRSPVLFNHPWMVSKLQLHELPFNGWEIVDDDSVFNPLRDTLKELREQLHTFENKVHEYKMKPSVTVRDADALGKMRAVISRVTDNNPHDPCGPALLAFQAVDTHNLYMVYSYSNTCYTVDHYPGNVKISDLYIYTMANCHRRGHRYKIVSDTGLLIMKEEVGLDYLESKFLELVNKFAECKNRQAS